MTAAQRSALVLAVLLSSVMSSSQIALAQQSVAEPPPSDLHYAGKLYRWEVTQDLVVDLAYETVEKQVELRWRHTGYPDMYSKDTMALSYYPTSVAPLSDPNKILVCGRTRLGGLTKIDLVTFQPPPVLQDLSGNAFLGSFTITSIETLYLEATPGRDMVAWISESLASDEAALLQFYDSKDLYSMNLEDGSLTHLASSTAQVDPLVVHVSELDSVPLWDVSWQGNHVAIGMVCSLSTHLHSAEVEENRRTLVFVDQNRDGIFETCDIVLFSEWGDSPFHDATAYTEIR